MAERVICKRNVIALLLAYFAVQLLARLAISDSAELDQSEQLILTQALCWGYESQPPLYTWLQAAVMWMFGTNLFSLCLLKNLLLFGTCLFVFLGAREITDDNRPAAAAMSSLFLIPQFAWESQRDLTHSVLATTCAAATLFVFLRLQKTRQPGYYALFGLCAGLGLIAKYNFALFLAALLLGALSLAVFRSLLMSKGMLVSMACFFTVALPHVMWMVNHRDAVLIKSQKLHFQNLPDSFSAYALGIQSLITTVAAFVAPLLVVYAILFYRSPPVASPVAGAPGDYGRLIKRTIIAGLLLCVAMIVCFKARFKDRWMQPLLFVAPIYLTTLALHKLDAGRFRKLLFINCLAAVIALAALSLAPLLASFTGSPSRINLPFSALAAGIKARGFQQGVIAAQDRLVAGNLKLSFQDSTVVSSDAVVVPTPRNAVWLIAWDATRERQPAPALLDFVSQMRRLPLSGITPGYLEAPLKYCKDRKMRLGFVLLDPEKESGDAAAP